MSTATAVLTTDIDSTRAMKEAQRISESLRKLSQTVIVPKIDTSKINSQIQAVGQQIKQVAGVTATPSVTVQSNVATVAGEIAAVLSVTQDWEKELKQLTQVLEKSASTARRGYDTRKMQDEIKTLGKQANKSSYDIRKSFTEIINKARELGASASSLKVLTTAQKQVSALSSNFVKVFKPFAGRASATALRKEARGYADYINVVKSLIQESAKAIGTIAVSPKVIVSPKPVVRSEAMTAALSQLRVDAGKWLQEDFMKRFEWRQGAQALVSEAEAAFSRESVMRQIYNAIFSFTPTAGGFGYFVGKLLETVAGVFKLAAKSLPTALVGVVELFNKATLGVFSKITGKLQGGIRAVFQPLSGIIAGVFSLFQALVNKYTISLLMSLQAAIRKIVLFAFLKLGKTIFSAAKAMVNKIRSTISGLFRGLFSGLSGAGGQAGAEIGGFSLGQLIGIGGLGISLKLAANVEEQMLNVATIINQMGASLKAATRNVIDVSSDFGKSAVDVARALYDIASAGFKGANSMVVLRNSLALAKGGMTAAATASAAVVRTLRAWDLPAIKSTSVADILFNVVRRGVTTFDELAMQITRVTSIASGAGVSFSEVGALLANLTRNGQRTEQAVLGLAQLFKSIIAPTAEGARAAKEIGLVWDETAVKAKGFVQVLVDAAPKILANKGIFKALVGDVQALKSALILTKDLAGLREDMNIMKQRGASAMAAAQMAISFNAQLEKFWTNFINILRNIGQILLPLIQPVLEKVVEWTREVSRFTNTNFATFIANLKNAFTGVVEKVAAVVGSLMAFLYQKFQQTKDFLLAVMYGFFKGVGPILLSAVKALGQQIVEGFIWILKEIIFSIGRFVRELIITIDLILELYLGKVYTAIKSVLGFIWSVVTGIMKLLWGLVKLIGSLISYILPGSQQMEWQTKKLESAVRRLDSALDMNKNIRKFGERFSEGFQSVWKGAQEYKFEDTGVMKAFSELGSGVLTAGKTLISTSSVSLKAQASGIRILIRDLEKTYNDELKAGDKTRATLTKQFIDQERDRLTQITKQFTKSELERAIERRHSLYIQLAKAQRAESVAWQKMIIDRIKENEALLIKLEEEGMKKWQENIRKNQFKQAASIEELKKQALSLVDAIKKAGSGLVNLNTVLDDIFGKNVERIAREYGVGRELAASRKLARDVIEAKAAGFKREDIDIVITRGLMQKSAALTRVLTAFQKTKQKLQVKDIKELGLYEEVVKLLDRASALGLSEEGRRKLLQGAVSDKTFQAIDSAAIADKQTNFINEAMKRFTGIEEDRKLQERFNNAALKLSELTKQAVTERQVKKERVEKLEKVVAEIERYQTSQEVVRTTGGP